MMLGSTSFFEADELVQFDGLQFEDLRFIIGADPEESAAVRLIQIAKSYYGSRTHCMQL